MTDPRCVDNSGPKAGPHLLLLYVAPYRRNVTNAVVGDASAFLCSDCAAGITGERRHVNAGLIIVDMIFPEAPASD